MKKTNKNHGNEKRYEEIYKEYNSQFSEECVELLVYNEHMSYGFPIFQGIIEEHWSAFLACIDVASGRVIKEFGTLTWPVDKKKYKKNRKIKLKDNTIYRVRIKKRLLRKWYFNGKLIETTDCASNKHRVDEYMLVDILDKKIKNKELEEAAALAKQPFVIHTEELGDFAMQRAGGYVEFSGQIMWMGEKCEVTLCPDAANTRTIDKSIEALNILASSMDEWDRKVKDFAADELAEDDGMIYIYTWESEEGTPVSKEEFKRRISLEHINIETSGDFCFSYEYRSDEMVTEHMYAEGNISGKMKSASLDG